MIRTGTSIAALAALLALSPAALAQTAPPQKPAPAPAATEVPKAPVAGQIVTQDANTVLAKDLIGLTVYATDKSKIGSISDLILSKDAKTVDGFVIGVGGFLGIGEKSVALKMDRLQISHNGDGGIQLMMDVKKEELANAPSFKSRKEQESERQAQRARDLPPTQKPTPQR